jgi:hypothetical protein
LALCTQLDVEQKLQWDVTAEPDTTVTALIADAQALIESHVGRPLESGTRTDIFDGGRVALFLRTWPVTEITTVTEDGTVLTADDFKWYPNGKVIRTSTTGSQILWKAYKPQSIEVVYEGGYLAATDDLHDIALEHLGSLCAEVVARAFRAGAKNAVVPVSAGAGGVQSVTIDGRGTISYATGGGETLTLEGGLGQFIFLNDDERRQLGRYRSVPLGFA